MILYQLHVVVAYFLSINLTTFCVYGYDKKIALSSWVRVPEKLLHTLSLVGGSPAALIAQRLFRHKTIKSSFQTIYWSIVCIQLVILVIVAWRLTSS